jgi:hypothetical protein
MLYFTRSTALILTSYIHLDGVMHWATFAIEEEAVAEQAVVSAFISGAGAHDLHDKLVAKAHEVQAEIKERKRVGAK